MTLLSLLILFIKTSKEKKKNMENSIELIVVLNIDYTCSVFTIVFTQNVLNSL